MRDNKNIYCNGCGKEMVVENDIVKEGIFSIKYPFGYFSDKDGQIHQFDLCEKCYDQIIKNFQIPCQIEENTEYL
jgi:ribosomal-protein-alanine N-acetyltransferase